MKIIVMKVLALLACVLALSCAEVLKVGTAIYPPFVIQNTNEADNGTLFGFSISYMEEMIFPEIQKETNYTSLEWVVYPTVTELIDVVANPQMGDPTIGIEAIPTSSQNARLVDFSIAYYRSGLQIGVKTQSNVVDDINIFGFLEPFEAAVWVSFIVGSFCSAVIVWLIERSKNPEFPNEFVPGLKEALWWSFMTLFHSSNIFPVTSSARIYNVAWGFMGMIFMSAYTANLATLLSTRSAQAEIFVVTDLAGLKVGAIRDSPASVYVLQNLPSAELITYENIDFALVGLLKGDSEIDAILAQSPVLLWFFEKQGKQIDFGVRGQILEPQDQAMILTKNQGTLKNIVDRAVLKYRRSEELQELQRNTFGVVDVAASVSTTSDATFGFWDFGGIWLFLIAVGAGSAVIWMIDAIFFQSDVRENFYDLNAMGGSQE